MFLLLKYEIKKPLMMNFMFFNYLKSLTAQLMQLAQNIIKSSGTAKLSNIHILKKNTLCI